MRRPNYDSGMIAMAEIHGEYITVTEATEMVQVNGTLIRRELRKHLDAATGRSTGGRVSGYLLNERTWLVKKSDVVALAKSLGWKAGRPRDAKKPESRRKKRS